MDAFYLFVLILASILQSLNGQVVLSGDPKEIPPNPHKKNSPTSGTISMGTPDLSDEDSQSIHMPNYLKCDACRIIAMRFSQSLQKEIDKFASVKRGDKELTEDRVLEIFEGVCDDKWEAHGIKEVDGVNRLSGPGFETSDIPGVMQGGGKWPFRFKQMCHIMLGDVGEDTMYETHRDSGAEGVEKMLCHSKLDGKRSYCEKEKSKKKSKGGKATESKKSNKKKSHNEL